jgi:hypothetical protein
LLQSFTDYSQTAFYSKSKLKKVLLKFFFLSLNVPF